MRSHRPRHRYQTNEEKIADIGPGGEDCCTFAVPEDEYLLRLNTSNSRGWTITNQYITVRNQPAAHTPPVYSQSAYDRAPM